MKTPDKIYISDIVKFSEKGISNVRFSNQPFCKDDLVYHSDEAVSKIIDGVLKAEPIEMNGLKYCRFCEDCEFNFDNIDHKENCIFLLAKKLKS